MRSLLTWFILLISACVCAGFDPTFWNTQFFAPGHVVDVKSPAQKNFDEDNAGFIRPSLFSGASASSSTRRLIQPPPLKRNQGLPQGLRWYRI
ncbi:unnamed protein product [Bursaphelenchus okinawaensis]|uniref:Uncharacterized protein n=1 Tax=Bursaphelenchus okinawaensis TaxID=465554 RepID=A0A811KK36_9BILA|nr:unnamed protein product [Bursaphelenchus okinawaensis]CAG9104514.1 unnamed protein product [Bursaphelenchus okinawaensis]